MRSVGSIEGANCRRCAAPFSFAVTRGAKPIYCSAQCKRASQPSVINRIHPPRRRFTSCQQCGAPLGRRNQFCSQTCRSAAPSTRAAKAAKKAQRRSIEFSPSADRIDPIAVFERDGWRCYLCGVLTPRAERGTTAPTAPQLEHILPLAKGGTHTWSNVACSCRLCNQSKGAKVLETPHEARPQSGNAIDEMG